MEKGGNPKINEVIAFRFKKVREEDFHSKTNRKGKRSDNTQEDFAEYLNVTPQTIRNYEHMVTPIDKKHLIKLAKDFNISLDYLLGEDDYKTDADKRKALNEKDWEEKIIHPIEIEECVIKLCQKLGFELIEHEYTGKDFNLIEMHYDDTVSEDEVIRNFEEAIQYPDIQRYDAIKYNGRIIYLLSKTFDSIISDIAGYAKFKLEAEFKKGKNYKPYLLRKQMPNDN